MAKITVKNLTFSYPNAKKDALCDINLNIKQGEFVVICGKSGCGKTTLLRHLKPELTPYGNKSGEILFGDVDVLKLDRKTTCSQIGFVLQNPENQIVTDKVWHELAFGLESLGYDNQTIHLKVAETANFFGISDWFYSEVSTLSGGQKQLLNLASIMAMNPSVLILDEPTAQLDPISASKFLEAVYKINRDIGTTVIMTEHRLEEVFPLADTVIVMQDGQIIADGDATSVGEKLKQEGNDMFVSFPCAMQIYSGIETDLECPVTVKEGREFLDKLFDGKDVQIKTLPQKTLPDTENTITIKNLYFKYNKNSKDVIKDLNFNVKKGTLHAIVGVNGSGKTTLLNVICGLLKQYSGKVKINGNKGTKELTMLTQNPQTMFVKNTVKEDLLDAVCGNENAVDNIAKKIDIEHLLQRHPFDLSGGEMQRVAIAKVLLQNPKILLLDEPTKGIDNFFKKELAKILKGLTQDGVTVLMVSHDIEFCAKYADVCSMFFEGEVVSTGTAQKFFGSNNFYTSAANRISRHIFDNAVTDEDVICLCNKNL
ncbi:MAG: energy-coupling factor ABC transporter ATP-binding protein [Oscillospiraceae bacterium]|nr:energy-coupling factor ABC transporter ATP-binding protein [Oscillospiraceae bacterium]